VRLVHFPGVAAAVVAAALVLALTATSGRLFLAAAGDAAVQQELDRVGGVPALTMVMFSNDRSDVDAVQGFASSVADHDAPRLARPVRTRSGPPLEVAAGGRSAEVRLAARDGFDGHVEVLQRVDGAGAWLPDTVARPLGVRAGQTVRVGGPDGVPLPVAGIYRDLGAGDRPLDPFWSPLTSVIYTLGVTRDAPPPLLLVDPDRFLALTGRLDAPGRLEWNFYPEPGRLTLPEADRLAAQIRAVESTVGDPMTEQAGFGRVTTSSTVGTVAGRAHDTVAALTGPVESISLTGRLLALVLMAAAAAFAVRRRRGEVLVLTAQGVGGLPLGLRSMAEAALPLAAGGVLGYLAALGLAGTLNPVPGPQPQALAAARREVAVALLAGLVLFGLVTWVAVRSEEQERAGRLGRALTRTWWEVLVLVLAAAALYELQTRGGGLVAVEGRPPRVDRLLVLFPLLLMAGLAGLATRGVARLLARPRLRPALTDASGRRPAPLLALRRLVAAPRLVLLLVTGSAVALGLLAYAGIAVASTRSAAAGKARVLVGSDTSLLLADEAPAGATTGLRATMVRRFDEVSLALDDRPVEMIAVDPATFATGAFWDDSFAGTSLGGLLRRLDQAPPGRLAAIAAGPVPADARAVDIGPTRLSLDVVATARAFPGMTAADRTLLVVSAAQLDAVTRASASRPGWRTEIWTREDPEVAAAALRRIGVVPESVSTAADVMRTPAFLAVSWTFRLLTALGALAGTVALASLVLYAQARQRGRVVAYALSRRMGLSRAAHRRSVLWELAGMLVFAFLLGTGLAVAASAVTYRSLDPMPQLPPGPALELPGAVLGASLLGILLAAVAGAFLVQRAADRANVAEVMRLAG
jgi:putative ABC transport system permease protein